MNCKNCGSIIEPNSTVCPNCGTPVENKLESQPTTPRLVIEGENSGPILPDAPEAPLPGTQNKIEEVKIEVPETPQSVLNTSNEVQVNETPEKVVVTEDKKDEENKDKKKKSSPLGTFIILGLVICVAFMLFYLFKMGAFGSFVKNNNKNKQTTTIKITTTKKVETDELVKRFDIDYSQKEMSVGKYNVKLSSTAGEKTSVGTFETESLKLKSIYYLSNSDSVLAIFEDSLNVEYIYIINQDTSFEIKGLEGFIVDSSKKYSINDNKLIVNYVNNAIVNEQTANDYKSFCTSEQYNSVDNSMNAFYTSTYDLTKNKITLEDKVDGNFVVLSDYCAN